MEPSSNNVPLWQSLIGSIGAFGVAAFTVWLTHRHTQQREADKDRRAKSVAKAADLKERLNAMMDDVGEAFFQATGSHSAAFAAAAQGATALPPPSFDIPTGDPVSIVVRVVSRAERHFPTLVLPLQKLGTAMMALDAVVTQGTADATASPEEWRKSRLAPYVEKFKTTSLPMIAAKQAVVDEARRLIVNDFDLEA
jgi:hypothetical protein